MTTHERHYVVNDAFQKNWLLPHHDGPEAHYIPTGALGGNAILRVLELTEITQPTDSLPTYSQRYLGRLGTGWDVLITTNDHQKTYVVDMYLTGGGAQAAEAGPTEITTPNWLGYRRTA